MSCHSFWTPVLHIRKAPCITSNYSDYHDDSVFGTPGIGDCDLLEHFSERLQGTPPLTQANVSWAPLLSSQ